MRSANHEREVKCAEELITRERSRCAGKSSQPLSELGLFDRTQFATCGRSWPEGKGRTRSQTYDSNTTHKVLGFICLKAMVANDKGMKQRLQLINMGRVEVG
jgi:hypothetical protein